MFNQTVLAGRLGSDLETRSTTNNKRCATIRLCTSTYSKGTEYTEWHTVVAWGDGLVGIIEKNLAKGDLILVTGQLRTRKWTSNKDGEARYSTEVVMGPQDQIRFLSTKKRDAKDTPAEPETRAYTPADLDDEIPF